MRFLLMFFFIFGGCKNVDKFLDDPSSRESSPPPNQDIPLLASCIDSESGASENRVRYELQSVVFGENCNFEIQTRTCSNGGWSNWSGTFTFATCTVGTNLDRDGDGITNEDDNCPDHNNPDQKDLDNNGEGDNCEEGYLNKLMVIMEN